MNRHFEGGEPLNPDELHVLDQVIPEIHDVVMDDERAMETLMYLRELLDGPVVPTSDRHHQYGFHVIPIDSSYL